MKATERITSTQVRHDWKNISAGLAAGKSFVVENHGHPEAIILPPNQKCGRFNLDEHFARVKKMPLNRVEITRSPEP